MMTGEPNARRKAKSKVRETSRQIIFATLLLILKAAAQVFYTSLLPVIIATSQEFRTFVMFTLHDCDMELQG